MKKIKINNRKKLELFALVSEEDFELVSKYKWHIDNNGYVRTQLARSSFLYLHRLVNKTPKGIDTDHINRNKLDNRRENLRTATRSINARNAPLRKDNSSGYKGIDFYKRIKKWRVRIGAKGLGYYNDLKKAIQVRKEAERSYGWLS